MVFTYNEFKTDCLSSVCKSAPINNSHSFCIYMFSNNVDLKNNNRNFRKLLEFCVCTNNCNEFVSS